LFLSTKVFRSFYHLNNRYNDPQMFDKIMKTINKYHDEKFQTLTDLIEIIKKHKPNIFDDTKMSIDDLCARFGTLVPQLQTIIQTYYQKFPQISKELRTILKIVISRTPANELSAVEDIFTGEPFCFVPEQGAFRSSQPPAALTSQTTHEHPPFQINELKRWPTDCLLQLLSLMEEQTYWVTLINSILQNIPDNELDERIQSDRKRVQTSVEDMFISGELNSIKNASDDQKRRGFQLFTCLRHIGKDESKSQKLINILGSYPEISVLNTLRQLVTLSLDDKYLDADFVTAYEGMKSTLLTLFKDYYSTIKQVNEAAVALRAELKNKVTPENAKAMHNMFSRYPLFYFNITENDRGIPTLRCIDAPSFIADTETRVIRTIEYRVLPSLNCQDCAKGARQHLDLAKMSPARLNELASLLHEQSNCIELFDIIFRASTTMQADK